MNGREKEGFREDEPCGGLKTRIRRLHEYVMVPHFVKETILPSSGAPTVSIVPEVVEQVSPARSAASSFAHDPNQV